MRIDAVSIGQNAPYDVNVIVEVPLGGVPVKYEMDKNSGALVVDRFLHTPMFYPANYGFIPHTLSDDGDPIDMLVAGRIPVQAGAILRARPIGVLVMEDEKGEDEKVLGVPHDELSPYFTDVSSYRDLPKILVDQIAHFFEHYKDLEKGKWVKVQRWGGAEEAVEYIRKAIERVEAVKETSG